MVNSQQSINSLLQWEKGQLFLKYCNYLLCLTPLSTLFKIIPWRSVLLVEETIVPGENHRPVAIHCMLVLREAVCLTSVLS